MAYDFGVFKKNIAEREAWLKKELGSIRTGIASPSILDSIKVESYGTLLGIEELGSIAIEEARTLRIIPWDMSQAKSIEKAINQSSLGLGTSLDEKGLRVIFPELTSDRRKDIARNAKEKLEEAKKSLRISRDEVMKDLDKKEKSGGVGKDDVFRFKKEAENLMAEANKKLEELYNKKEKEILG